MDWSACRAMKLAGKDEIECQSLLSGGLVGTSGTEINENPYSVLFAVPPIASLLLIIISLYGVLVQVAKNRCNLVVGLCLSAYSFFLFGWHVHEKATLMFAVPMGLLITQPKWAGLYWELMMVSTFAVFPLIFRPQELLLKWAILGLYAPACWWGLQNFTHPVALQPRGNNQGVHKPSVPWLGVLLLTICGLAEVFCSVVHPVSSLGKRYPFLGLLAVSVTNAVTVLYLWLRLCAEAQILKFGLGLIGSLLVLCCGRFLWVFFTN
eukprot:TRINITY_DN26067_c0_g1_i1.p1 TRINITY_DN26067_c0_g1~~TRINITY_DN26067_c0_g1_i1.p1  ORF type:complete len:265 (-),score=7.28 TRINITY_DN26067_c0_g1_i1:660-1454(-)